MQKLRALMAGAFQDYEIFGTVLLVYGGKEHPIDNKNWVQESRHVFGAEDAEIRFEFTVSKKVRRSELPGLHFYQTAIIGDLAATTTRNQCTDVRQSLTHMNLTGRTKSQR